MTRGGGSPRIVLSGGAVVLPNRVSSPATLVLQDGLIQEILPGPRPTDAASGDVDCSGRYILPGFIDVHVHGVEGTDTLDGPEAIARIAVALPRYGVTAFCPTSIACAPAALQTMVEAVSACRSAGHGARVLPAHLESNFINPDYRGAQPLDCLRTLAGPQPEGEFTGAEILEIVRASREDVGIMTVAPEVEGALPLIREMVSMGIHVSLGHSGATYDEGGAGIDAGGRQATHLFNRMPPLGHRAPGLAAAVLERDEVRVEVIPDCVHVHPAMVRLAFRVKGPGGLMTITDGTAGSGLATGARARLGGRPITVRDAAYLDDGTVGGSVLTMDRAFVSMVRVMNLGLVDAARTCSTTPALALGLTGHGTIVEGAVADVVVLDQALQVVATYIAGELAWSRPA